jgi:hypothetical protein
MNSPEEMLSATGWVNLTPKSIPTGKIETEAKQKIVQPIAVAETFIDLSANSSSIGLISVIALSTYVTTL